MLGLNIVIVRIDNMKMLITLYWRKVEEKNKNKNNKKNWRAKEALTSSASRCNFS